MTRSTSPPPRGRFRRILGYASLALVLFLLVAGFRGFRDLTLARERVAQLEQAIDRAEEEVVRLTHRVERLRTDPVLLERLAREDLGMVRAGDVVVLFESETPSTRPTSTPKTRPAAAPSSGPPEPVSP